MITRSLLETAGLPFAGKVELLGFGSGSTVFRLGHGGHTPRVLKVYRRSLGQRRDGLRLLAHDFRSKYTTIRRWYEGADFILPTQFIILQSPLRGYSAVACVQRYIPDAGEDFLALPDDEVLALLRANRRLRQQFRRFAECTLRALEHERRCPDLLGYGNLTLSRGEAGVSGDASSRPRLWLLDFGIFDLGPAAATLAVTRRRLTVLLERIRRLNAAASSFPPAAAGAEERTGRQGGAREVVGASGSP